MCASLLFHSCKGLFCVLLTACVEIAWLGGMTHNADSSECTAGTTTAHTLCQIVQFFSAEHDVCYLNAEHLNRKQSKVK